MSAALRFWVLMEVAGLAAIPISAFLFARLPGRGLGFARPLALLLIGYPAWMLASLHLVPYSLPIAWLGFVVVVLAGGYGWVRRSFRASLRDSERIDLRLWVCAEILFTVGFFSLALLRSYVPDVWQTEKPMDMAFINAIDRSSWFPPLDPWLSGATLNYYYFGHYLVSLVTRLSGVAPSVGFNLGVALIFGLTLSAVFTVGSSLALAAGGLRRSLRTGVLAGVAAVGLVLLLGNLAGGVQFLGKPTALAAYDWWSPSRVILNTANEFPYFSFLLADLHAHVMASPFLLLALGLALQITVAGPRAPWTRAWVGEIALCGLAIGCLYAINSLDFPLGVAFMLGACLLWSTRAADGRAGMLAAVSWTALVLAVGGVLFLPFWAQFVPSVGGLALLPDRAGLRQFLHDYLLIYGLTLWVLAAAFAVQLGRLGLRGRILIWNGVPAVALLVVLAPAHLDGVVLLCGAVAIAGLSAWSNHQPQALRYFWFLAAVGFGLILVTEVVYIRDAFAGSPFYRFNTVFKLGYQAWFVLGIAAGVFLLWAGQWLDRRVHPYWVGGAVLLVGLAAIYPVAGSYAREAGFAASPSLSGERWLASGDRGAIDWMRTHVRGNPVILEAVGPDYDPQGRARISTFTGLPTVLGWAGHELQWSHSPGTRYQDVRLIYNTLDVLEAHRLLDRYAVRYVVVGSLERRDYPVDALAKFVRLGLVVYDDGGTTVYDVTANPTSSSSTGAGSS